MIQEYVEKKYGFKVHTSYIAEIKEVFRFDNVRCSNTVEELHNPNFNRLQFEAVKNEAGLNRFVMTPTKWITQMNDIGIVWKNTEAVER